MVEAKHAAVAAGATAVVAAGGLLAYKALAAQPEACIVVFADGKPTGARLEKTQCIDLLRGQVEAQLHADGARLFLMQAADKRELTSSEQLAAALADPSLSIQGALLLVATTNRAGLSAEAAAAPPLAPVPVGPKPLPFVGNFPVYLKGPLGVHGALGYNPYTNLFAPDKQAVWGDTVVLRLPNCSAGHDPCLPDAPPGNVDLAVTTCDPEVVGELLERQDDFPKLWGREVIERKLQAFAGNGLFTSSTLDHDWQVAHGLLPRAFNQIRIKNYFPVILDKTRGFVAAWQRRAPGSLIDDVNDWLTCMTADAVTKAAMGLDMANVENKAKGLPLHPFIDNFRYGLKAAVGRASVKSEFGRLAALNPFFGGKAKLEAKLDAAVATCNDIVADLLERTRKGEIGGANSVLSAMLNDISPSTGDYVRLGNIYGQCINLMIAGHETTAATLGFTLFYIATHPEVEAKVLAELDAVLGPRFEPAADDIPKLVYVEACFREALRLHPAVATVTRDVPRDTTLKGKWFVAKGQRIDINNVSLQRREDQWGGRFGPPDSFNPERFMPGAAEESGRHPNAFNPWGFGIRACIGSQFALWEAKTFLAMVLRVFKLRVPDGYVALPSTSDGGAAPSPHHLALHIWTRAGGEQLLKTMSGASAASGAEPAAAAAANGSAPAAAAPAKAAAGPSHGTPVLVLYGSNMGTCEELAGNVAAQASAAGFAAKVASLDAAVKGGATLPTSGAVLVLSSTYNGTPPDNAQGFAKWLAQQAPGALAGVTFSVFGVGNSQWQQTFQAFPTQVALQMAAAGATQVLELQTCDVDGTDWMDSFEAWNTEVVRGLLVHFGQAASDEYLAALQSGAAVEAKDRLRLRLLDAGEAGQPVTVAQAIERLAASQGQDDRYWMLEVLENRELQGSGSSRSTRHVQLALPEGPGGAYVAGEHLEVMGNNDPAIVDAALKLLGLSGDQLVEWTTNVDDSTGTGRGLGAMPKLTMTLKLATALTWLVDLAAVPAKRVVAQLAEACPCPPEAAKLKAMASDDGYKAQVASQRLTLVELLTAYRSVPISLERLVNLLPRMGPRYYSISSSPLARPGTCSISVGKVAFTTPTGRQHKGAASAMIAATPVGGHLVGCVRRLSSSFRLPQDASLPVILIGPGTGVAPMMGFLQERAALAAQGVALGPAHLFFGCRNSSEDFIYREELEGYASSGVLAGLHTAFSREGATKVYVQDLILQQGQALWGLFQAGAYVYVCGDARRMAPDVRAAFKEVAKTWGGRTGPAVESWMGGLLESKRYLEDVWAG